MAKKRKPDATPLDDLDRTMYLSFSSAANSLSQLYSQSMSHQRLSFQAAERHALEKLYQWILKPQEDGARVSMVDVVTYLQNELEYGAEDLSISPRLHGQHQHHQTVTNGNYFGVSSPSNSFIPPGRFGHTENQSKSSIFCSALSSPVRRSLQHYHSAQAGLRNGEIQSRDLSNSPVCGDCMDI